MTTPRKQATSDAPRTRRAEQETAEAEAATIAAEHAVQPEDAASDVHPYTRVPRIIESTTYGRRPFDKPAPDAPATRDT